MTGIPRGLRELASTLLIVLIVVGASRLLVQTVQIQGPSMQPTLHTGELVLIDTLSPRLHGPNRGDIIIFHPPVAPRDDYVKRVIGLPGDVVKITDGTVYVNGHRLSEPYLHRPHTYSFPRTRVPAGDLFVLGDNRDISYDSHLWPTPFLAENQVIGRAIVAYWPPSALRLFSPPATASGK